MLNLTNKHGPSGHCCAVSAQQGERILLLYPPGLAYIAAFFGCLYAGATAIPGYPPRFHRSLERLQSMAADAQASVALTTTSFLAKTKQWFTWTPELSNLRWLSTDQLDLSLATTWTPPAITGQTGRVGQKGVVTKSVTNQEIERNAGVE